MVFMQEEKLCRKCGYTKSLSEFGKNKHKKDGHQTQCKACFRERNKIKYKADSSYRERLVSHKKKYRQRNREYTWDFLIKHPCVDCGETDPVVLEFDHVRGEKKFSISRAIHAEVKLSTIQEEIEKCEVRCANCHRRKTHREFEYYSGPLAQLAAQ